MELWGDLISMRIFRVLLFFREEYANFKGGSVTYLGFVFLSTILEYEWLVRNARNNSDCLHKKPPSVLAV